MKKYIIKKFAKVLTFGAVLAISSPLLNAQVQMVKPSDMANFKSYHATSNFDPQSGVLNVKVLNETDAFYSIQMDKKTESDIEKGDVLHIKFKARCLSTRQETSEGGFTVYVQQAQLPWQKTIAMAITPSAEWRDFSIPFESDLNLPAQKGAVCFGFGGIGKQEIEIKDLEMINYKNTKKTKDLPHTAITYKGIESDAPWRSEAQKRIDEIRKQDLQISVVDKDGNPVSGAEIALKQTESQFAFGSVVSLPVFSRKDSDFYKQKFLENFNATCPENAVKWANVGTQNARDAANYQDLQKFFAWADENNLQMRGHVLLWGSKRYVPKYVLPLFDSPEQLRATILEHVESMVTTHKKDIKEWDVVNEPFDNHDVADVLGTDIYIDCFKQARKSSPKAKLYLNDYGILSNPSTQNKHAKFTYELIEKLIESKCGITGVGLQSHFGSTLTPPTRVYEILEQFANLGLDIRITEFDVDLPNEDIQAAYLRDFLTICFSHKNVKGFQHWGFWAGAHWKPRAAMFDTDWRAKPNQKVWEELTRKTWRTNFDGKSAENPLNLRAFKGEYTLTAKLGDKIATKTFKLGDKKKSIAIELK